MLDLTVDPQVLPLAPWRAELRRQVGRMIVAAARAEAEQAQLAAAKAAAQRRPRAAARPARPAVPTLEASLRLTDDETIRELNREFRHKDKPTDVLAFAQREGPWAGAGHELLGDIIISLPTARRQAKQKSPLGLFTEVRFLAAHGLCHLLGYDHNDDEEERVMNARMARLLEQAPGRGLIAAA
jgi:probable rRNA maturation factor